MADAITFQLMNYVFMFGTVEVPRLRRAHGCGRATVSTTLLTSCSQRESADTTIGIINENRHESLLYIYTVRSACKIER